MATALNFPVLSRAPIPDFGEQYDDDNTIKAKFESGYELTRARHNRIRSTFPVKYEMMTAADRVILRDFYENVTKGATLDFNWVHPVTGISYDVRFVKGPEIKYAGFDRGPAWNFSFQLREV